MAVFAALFRRRPRSASPSPRPPGADDVRLLDTPDAVLMAEAASTLAAIGQSLAALEALRLRSRRPPPEPHGPDALTDLALLRHGVVQFVDCFEAGRRAGGPSPETAFGGLDGGAAFYRHLCAFRDQLSGPHARLVGSTQPVALLRRAGDQTILVGVATRTRRPDRLTEAELAQMIAFIGHARTAWTHRLEEIRERVVDQARALSPDDLDRLPPAPAL